MADLLALADRVEKEAAGSRELDALIWAEIDGRDVRWDGNMLLGKYRKPPHDECRIGYIDPGVTNRNFSLAWSQPPIPSYTASIDAAMLLVPEGMEWLVRSASHLAVDNKDQCYANVGNQSGEAHADTGSCALCAAALRALRNERLASRQEASVEELARLIDPIAFNVNPSMYGLRSQDELESRTLVGGVRGVARDKALALRAEYFITKREG